MIYVSTACLSERNLNQNLKTFKKLNIKNIELTGNILYEKDYKKILNHYKLKYKFNFLIHNYFPIPKKPFMLNLGTENSYLNKKSVDNCLKSIELCNQLKLKKFSVHAPFLVNFKTSEAGKKIKERKISSKSKILKIFKKNFNLLKKYVDYDVKLYVENNVLSKENFLNFNKQNPLMLTSFKDYDDMRQEVNFTPLLDTGHLKVSCKTLKLDFKQEFNNFSKYTDFIQVSDNNSLLDQNKKIKYGSQIYKLLKSLKNKKNTYSLEVYGKMKNFLDTIKILNRLNK